VSFALETNFENSWISKNPKASKLPTNSLLIDFEVIYHLFKKLRQFLICLKVKASDMI
jgi:hypothetical protein